MDPALSVLVRQRYSEALQGAGDTHAAEPLRGELLLVSEMKFHF